MNERDLLKGLLRGYSIDTEADREFVADYLISLGAVIRPKAVWETENEHTTCSICHYPAPIFTVRVGLGETHIRERKTKFCPNCGAKMLGR